MADLSFQIKATLADSRGKVRFTATVDGQETTCATYKPGDHVGRRRVAKRWASDERLRNGAAWNAADIERALEARELAILPEVERLMEETSENEAGAPSVQAASIVTPDLITELAWNGELGVPDFIVYDRKERVARRASSLPIGQIEHVPPSICQGIVTPGHPVPGSVLLPTSHDETGIDEEPLRSDLLAYLNRYVELPPGLDHLAVDYILLSWIFDDFDELPYLAFRTADAGRGKSRALEAVGALCYRPIFCGGGSSAAATLRLLDVFRGTLVADEFDQRDSELASEITKILNQGFQRGRPLVRCDGDKNTPRAFQCFGPKLFALRRGFADDATETRLISITMRQRTRDDVPINLPRAAFDAEALRLRNRLLAWRFAYKGTFSINPRHADSRLEDRFNQIAGPLLSIARDASSRRRIVTALVEQQAGIASDRADTLAGEVLAGALAIAKVGEYVRPAAVAVEVNRRRAAAVGVEPERLGARAISPHKVGWVLKGDLELPRERIEGGTQYRLDPTRLRLLTRRFGIDLETLPGLQGLPADPTGDPGNPGPDPCKVEAGLKPTLPVGADCLPTSLSKSHVLDSANAGPCRAGNPCNVLNGDPATVGESAVHGSLEERQLSQDQTTVGGTVVPDPIVPVRSGDRRNLETNVNNVRIPEGWNQRAWVWRLRKLANFCEATQPGRAAELRRWAGEIAAG